MKKIFLTKIAVFMMCFSTHTYAQIGINTENPLTDLHVEGDMIVTKTDVIEGGKSVVISDKGFVGKSPGIPAKIMFAQGTSYQNLSQHTNSDRFNTQNEKVVVQWLPEDITTNNIIDFIPGESAFKFRASGTYEVGGYINYMPSANVSSDVVCNLSVIIQYARKETPSKWEDLAGTREIFTTTTVNWVKTVIVAPAVLDFNAGDKVRVIFGKWGGSYHFTNRAGGISRPDGAMFTRGFKIMNL